MVLLYGCRGRLTPQNGGSRPGQEYDEMKERQMRAAAGATAMKTDEQNRLHSFQPFARLPQKDGGQQGGGQQTKAERVGLVKK